MGWEIGAGISDGSTTRLRDVAAMELAGGYRGMGSIVFVTDVPADEYYWNYLY